jgi:hypothetical protein
MVASGCEDDQHDIKHWHNALTTSYDTSKAYDTRTQLEYNTVHVVRRKHTCSNTLLYI